MTIARHEHSGKADIWAQLAAPLPASVVQWRQQGKGKPRDGKYFAPFVAYIDAQFVRDRLDMIVPGEWDLNVELLPTIGVDGNGEVNDEPIAFKARLNILGVIREDVGTGRDYKTASTDAFKRAAVRFGIGHELYTDYEILWVQVDGDGKYAKALEDPAEAYLRRQNRSVGVKSANAVESSRSQRAESGGGNDAAVTTTPARQQPAPTPAADSPLSSDEPNCPKCGGRMWDNRLSKRNKKAPDFKCRSRSCDGVIWPPKPGEKSTPLALADDDEWEPAEPPDEIPF